MSPPERTPLLGAEGMAGEARRRIFLQLLPGFSPVKGVKAFWISCLLVSTVGCVSHSPKRIWPAGYHSSIWDRLNADQPESCPPPAWSDLTSMPSYYPSVSKDWDKYLRNLPTRLKQEAGG